ncbi:MAG: 16S rRNA (cytosine(967)-C(5))-methyltransferase RsmB [Gammaproteobacteria bacterium]|nr:16S rRNA (cytosine(967)-C(5))-methyltransferase RsmB [Gammaproteobacteria bacterium]
MTNTVNARAAAARVLGKLLSEQGSLTSQLAKYSEAENSALIREICFGVCRYYFALKAVVDGFLTRPLRSKDHDVYCLLLVGAYQLYQMRIPDHAAVNETVQAARNLKKPWARGLVNSLLRRLIENQEQWPKLLDSGPDEARYLHPHWLISTLQQDWPDHWTDILQANNQRAPMCLRLNQLKTSRDEYLKLLEQAGHNAFAGKLANTAIYLEAPCDVDSLPGFREGMVSVQDEASQLVATLLELEPGLALLDACAAPGGKACHILESEPALTRLLALDIDEPRLRGIEENLRRLGLQAQIKAADALQLDHWWDGEPFQRILLDAPCSATGVIRRHPDIKILRKPQDIGVLAQRQLKLMQSLWQCLAPGGLLLYTTCSVLKAENEQTVERFLATSKDAKYQAITADWGLKCAYGRQLLPDTQGSDGFYYALLRKC